MDAGTLRERAQHLRRLAELVADERTLQVALRLAADCDRQADALEQGDDNCVVSSAHSSSPVRSAPASGPFVEPGDKPRTETAKLKHVMASPTPISPSADTRERALCAADG